MVARDVASFELSMARDAMLIATVRRFVAELCLRTIHDADITSRVIVATHELLDNAMRYALEDETRIRVAIQRVRGEVEVVIETRNRVNDVRSVEIQRLIGEIQESKDGATFYQGLLRRSALLSLPSLRSFRSVREEGSGLGLGRVHAESGMTLSSRVEDGILDVRAEGRFALEPAR